MATEPKRSGYVSNAELARRMRAWAQIEDDWRPPSAAEAGERLRALLGLAERLPRRPREPLTFPPIRRRAAPST